MKNFKMDEIVKVKKIVIHRPYAHDIISSRIKIGEIGKVISIISYHLIHMGFYIGKNPYYFRNTEIMFRSELTDATDEEKEGFLEREEICIANETARRL